MTSYEPTFQTTDGRTHYYDEYEGYVTYLENGSASLKFVNPTWDQQNNKLGRDTHTIDDMNVYNNESHNSEIFHNAEDVARFNESLPIYKSWFANHQEHDPSNYNHTSHSVPLPPKPLPPNINGGTGVAGGPKPIGDKPDENSDPFGGLQFRGWPSNTYLVAAVAAIIYMLVE